MLHVGRLAVLCAVVEHRSFSAAAVALSYTQSAVSQSIARLEAETGVQLVIRGRRGASPTAAGRTLAEHAAGILAAIDEAEAALAEVSAVQLRRLRVATFPSGGAALMPLAVARFRRTHPDVALTLADGEPGEIAPRLRAGELDLALLFEFPEDPPADGCPRRPGRSSRPASETSAGLCTVTLLEDPMELVLPAAHPLSHRPALGLADLRDESWVQPSSAGPCARHVVRCCRAAGFEPDVCFESDDYDTVQGLVAAGVGVALVPRLALGRGLGAATAHPGVVVRPLAPALPPRRVFVAGPAGVTPTPPERSMIRELIEIAGRHAAEARASAPG
ncbi:MAG TPA: LysR family transcriptional regulator [Solirubrobacteraceae bacterium]|nr:LysR family transcriptional regulator [Solirubrobacteraceae bacterium]